MRGREEMDRQTDGRTGRQGDPSLDGSLNDRRYLRQVGRAIAKASPDMQRNGVGHRHQ